MGSIEQYLWSVDLDYVNGEKVEEYTTLSRVSWETRTDVSETNWYKECLLPLIVILFFTKYNSKRK